MSETMEHPVRNTLRLCILSRRYSDIWPTRQNDAGRSQGNEREKAAEKKRREHVGQLIKGSQDGIRFWKEEIDQQIKVWWYLARDKVQID